MNTRQLWLSAMVKIAAPVLESTARGTLQRDMPLYGSQLEGKETCTYLEAIGRTLCGIAPWLALEDPAMDEDEKALQARYRELARQALLNAVRPGEGRLNFSQGGQPIVDAAFLCQGILRAPAILWEPLSAQEKGWVVAALEETRTRKPCFSNWLLFSAIIEAMLRRAGVFWDPMRVDFALKQMEQWYVGDGFYSDGPRFALDYYNSFVIHPMLLDTCLALKGECAEWDALLPKIQRRATRYAAHLERLILPDGCYPVLGRSSAYRFGVFHALAQAALMHALPEGTTPAGVRCALTKVLERTLRSGSNFDADGWLRVGVFGHQPSIGEGYISTGSLYLCMAVFLPLGLPQEDPFWAEADAPFTQQNVWNGVDIPCDHAID